MPSPLHKVGYGLLALFNLKTLGRNPDAWSDELRPVADVTDHYSLDLTQVVNQTANVSVRGTGPSLTVPNGFVWRVRHAGVYITLTGAMTMADGVALSIWANTGGFASPMTQFESPIVSVGAGRTAGVAASIYFDRPLMLRPGSVVSGQLDRDLSGAMPLLLRLIIEPLQV